MFAKHLIVAVAVGLLAGLLAGAQQPANSPKKLSRTFTGVYDTGGTQRERVTLTIEKTEEKDGVITFTGTQSYYPYNLKEKATGRIELKTGKITFTVSEPTNAADIDGVFEGIISAKLDVITCDWINKGAGKMGTLKLTGREP